MKNFEKLSLEKFQDLEVDNSYLISGGKKTKTKTKETYPTLRDGYPDTEVCTHKVVKYNDPKPQR